MGLVEANTGFGRVNSASGWVIEAWHGNGSTPAHTAFRFGALNSTNAAAFASSCAYAYANTQSAWESWMDTNAPSGWTSWYGGLSGTVKAMVYECARFAGEHSLTP